MKKSYFLLLVLVILLIPVLVRTWEADSPQFSEVVEPTRTVQYELVSSVKSDTTTPVSTAAVHLPVVLYQEESAGTEETMPTPPVQMGGLSEDFARAHVSLENLPFVTIKGGTEIVVLPGGQTASGVVISISSSTCENDDVVENVKTVYKAFRNRGVTASLRAILSLILTESGFRNFVYSGGDCRLLQNYEGAPAYSITQIYEPGGRTHPEVSPELLSDTAYAADHGARIYGEFFAKSGDEVMAAACYKGFCYRGNSSPTTDPGFVNNFMGAYNSSGFWVDHEGGQLFIPFDEAEFLALPIW